MERRKVELRYHPLHLQRLQVWTGDQRRQRTPSPWIWKRKHAPAVNRRQGIEEAEAPPALYLEALVQRHEERKRRSTPSTAVGRFRKKAVRIVFESHFGLTYGRRLVERSRHTAYSSPATIGRRLVGCIARRSADKWMILIGDSGVGKSTVLRRLKHELDPTSYTYSPQPNRRDDRQFLLGSR